MQSQTLPNGKPRILDFKEQHAVNALKKEYRTIIMSRELLDHVRNFRCDNCGGIVFQYYNMPKAVFQGAINLEDCEQPTDHLCKRCNIIYRVT